MAKRLTKKDYLETLEGCEINSVRFGGTVAIAGGSLWQRGEKVMHTPTLHILMELLEEYANPKGITIQDQIDLMTGRKTAEEKLDTLAETDGDVMSEQSKQEASTDLQLINTQLLANTRQQLKLAKKNQSNFQEILEDMEVWKDVQYWKGQVKELTDKEATDKTELSKVLLGIHAETGEQKYDCGQVVMGTNKDVDENLAIQWAVDHNHPEFLRLDKPNMMRSIDFAKWNHPFVVITHTPKTKINSDLSKFLPKEKPAEDLSAPVDK